MSPARWSLNRVLIYFALLGALQLAPICTPDGSAMAQDCNAAGTQINLLSQGDVDNFQTDYGPCDRIGGSLDIRNGGGMVPITDLSPLGDLVEVGEFLWVQASMPSLNGLHNLVSVGEIFTITGSDQLTDLTGLTSLQSAKSLDLVGLSLLTSLAGMPNLTSVETLRLRNLNWLTDLSGLPAVVDINDLSIENAAELTSLDGAPAMDNLQFLTLDSTVKLDDLSGLSASTFAFSPDPFSQPSLTVTFNSGLTSLSGLPVGEKFGSIDISNNTALESLAGLENLVEVWGNLSVTENDFLADCSMLKTVLDDVDDGDPGPGDGGNPDDPPDTMGLAFIVIENNGEAVEPAAQCASIADILAGGGTELIHADGFESESL